MKAFHVALLGAFSGMLMAGTSSKEATPASAPAAVTGVKNIVLVHGAFADGSSWAKIIPLLEAKGYNVIAVQNPLTSLADDVAATKRAIALQNGPVLLVGHSWGGAVITEAGNDPRVAGLLYVAAGAPDAGQSFGEMAQTAPPPAGVNAYKADAAGFYSLTREGATKDFAQDLPAAESKLIFVTQGPWAARAVGDKISAAAWQTKPSWYIVAAEDRMINPDLERTLAKKIKATTLELKTSHVPMLSQPAKVAAFIGEAASKVAVQ
ncbi:alpha/beta fold hydrolase [Hymenobacter daeguensis]